jgi:hypothetical protein
MTAAAGTVVSCTVFLPAVNANQALQVPQTLIDQLHTRVESPSCMWIAVLPACTAQTYAFFYCASRMPESLSKLHAESATQLVLQTLQVLCG